MGPRDRTRRGAEDLLVACREAGRPVVVVTNNCAAAVHAYLERSGLADLIDHVESRDPSDPRLMKPHPRLLERAVGAASIGFAARPGAAAMLADAGADTVVDRLAELAAAAI